jgi:zinc D-Ala-D-Ala dipeptidase
MIGGAGLATARARPSMSLLPIRDADHGVEIALVYATERNFTGRPIYRHARCYLHAAAAAALKSAAALALAQGYRLKVLDAFRPSEAQWVMWTHTPHPDFLADPRRGSPHSRGVAVDLTLIDGQGRELDMGTGFDAFTPLSHHGNLEIPAAAQANRSRLLGIMTAAGWDFYRKEWWHYQLFDSRRFPLYSDSALAAGLM